MSIRSIRMGRRLQASRRIPIAFSSLIIRHHTHWKMTLTNRQMKVRSFWIRAWTLNKCTINPIWQVQISKIRASKCKDSNLFWRRTWRLPKWSKGPMRNKPKYHLKTSPLWPITRVPSSLKTQLPTTRGQAYHQFPPSRSVTQTPSPPTRIPTSLKLQPRSSPIRPKWMRSISRSVNSTLSSQWT